MFPFEISTDSHIYTMFDYRLLFDKIHISLLEQCSVHFRMEKHFDFGNSLVPLHKGI